MKDEELREDLPMAVHFEVGTLEPTGVALKITYAQNRERFEARKLDTVIYVFPVSVANELLGLLQKEMTGSGAVKH